MQRKTSSPSKVHRFKKMNTYYPALINLKGKKCIVVGGGNVAQRKIISLLRSGAIVKVISPELTDVLKEYKTKGKITHIKRKYRKGDLEGAFMVIAATSNLELNRSIAEDAKCLVNVVDVPEISNFIVPSAFKRGYLTIAVSTSGASPAIARFIRKELQNLYGKDFERFLNFLMQKRSEILKKVSDKRKREAILKNFAKKEIIKILREEGFDVAKNKIISEVKINL